MKPFLIFVTFLMPLFLVSCGENPKQETKESPVTTPVKIESVHIGPIGKTIQLPAITTYLRKNGVRAMTSGYVAKNLHQIGDQVKEGSTLFILQTKELAALREAQPHNTDFKGEVNVKSPSSGVIVEMNKQANDYISDGDQLCMIADRNSLMFQLNVPYELNRKIEIGQSCELLLPDSSRITGRITSKLTALDPLSQTQSYLVKPSTILLLPENLLATAQLSDQQINSAQIVSKSCVLADETMSSFWIMKLINDSTAIKVAVQKGIENDKVIQIVSPILKVTDRLISVGHYGLADTARIEIIK